MTEDVLLALKDDAVPREVVAAASGLKRSGARGGGKLRDVVRRLLGERRRQPKLPCALGIGVEAVQLQGPAREELLNLVRSQRWVLLQDQGDRPGGDGRRLRGAATPEVAGAEQSLRVVGVDV